MDISKFKIDLIHFFFAGILTSNAIVYLFKGGGVSNSIVLLVGGLVVLILLFSRFKPIVRLKTEQLLLFVFLFIILVFSLLFAPHYGMDLVKRQFFFFMLMGLGTLSVSNYDYDFEKLLKSIIIISLLVAPVLLTGNFTDKEGLLEIDEKEEWMGYGYAIVTFIIADLFYLTSYKGKWWKAISIVALLLYVPSFFWHSSRGAFGAIFGFLFLVFLQNKLLKGKKLTSSITGVFAIFLVLFVLYLVFDVKTLLIDSGMNSLTKFFEEDGDVSNGRSSLYAMAMDGFWGSPIWGNGVGSFANYTIYPHNLFVQFLYEGGGLLFGVMTWILYKSVRYILNTRIDVNRIRLLLFVFSCSFFELSFSASYWEKPRFWLTVWITLAIFNEFKKHRSKVYAVTHPAIQD